MGFWSKLFGKKEKVKVRVYRKEHRHLSEEDRSRLVTDIMINKETYKQVAKKYDISTQTARNIVKKARNANLR